jgi:hypothetical protein
MTSYPLDRQSEVDRALKSSLEMHSPRLPPSSADRDLALNPLRDSAKRNPLIPQGSSYLGPKRTADDMDFEQEDKEPEQNPSALTHRPLTPKVKGAAQSSLPLLAAAGLGLALGFIWTRYPGKA